MKYCSIFSLACQEGRNEIKYCEEHMVEREDPTFEVTKRTLSSRKHRRGPPNSEDIIRVVPAEIDTTPVDVEKLRAEIREVRKKRGRFGGKFRR